MHSCRVSERDSTAPAPVGSGRDPAFLRAVRPVIELYTSYFRSEVRGFEGLPLRGPFLVVGNHSGGQMPPDLLEAVLKRFTKNVESNRQRLRYLVP